MDSILTQEERDRLSDMNWPFNPKLWEHLMTVIDTVEEIYPTGGEPNISTRTI